jgi:KDO2-lipid IV(A) lauroyltransferase
MTRIILGVLWLAHFLPLRALAAIGNGIGAVAFWLVAERRKVTRINLEKCFPQMAPAERERLARASFQAFCRGVVDRTILWWASPERIRRMVQLEGLEHLDAAGPQVVIFAPHFTGVEATGVRISMDRNLSSLYARQKNAVLDGVLLRSRTRFRDNVISRQQGLRKALRWIKEGIPFYYLPDLDFGRNGSVFVPFFGVAAATARGLPYISRITGARVVPCITRMLPEGGYVARFYPAWQGYPTGDDEADARRMNAFLEERVLEMPEQYHWLHKRFKTRPEGEPRFY